ncbi:hypothetical protein [Paenibacillus sp. JNUCC31]|uniref:hypothetical protein n=2 Tax=unclassified Paenibacillus TaxID=185978 RepID=UPI001E46B739|nr:hypothetical protein [Paenibacillus sp. JNUCC-31]
MPRAILIIFYGSQFKSSKSRLYMILTRKEATVIEKIRNRSTRKEIARKLGISTFEVEDIVNDLVQRLAIQRSDNVKEQCEVLLDTYEIEDNTEKISKQKKTIEVLIPEGYEDHIRKQYGILPRREIARQLNLSKVTLNLMIMQLGLREKGMPELHNQRFFEQNEDHIQSVNIKEV